MPKISNTSLFILLSAFLLIILASPYTAFCIPSFDDVKGRWRSSEVMVYDRKDRLIQTIRRDFNKRALQWVSLSDISKNMVDAVLHSEDKRFFEHSGVDWLAMGSALLDNVSGKSRRGASTITMQLASILSDNKGKKDFSGKLNQIKTAWDLEATWTKRQILEAYLNLIYFRGELQGISSASHIIFNKSPSSLTVVESAILASLIRHPNASLDKIVFRASNVLDKMAVSHDKSSIQRIVKERLTDIRQNTTNPNTAPHIVKHLDLGTSQTIKTTIDMDIQIFTDEVLRKHLVGLRKNNVNDGSAIIIENKTGNVLAYVSNSTDFPHVDGIVSKRQAGSTLKPFLYALSLSKGMLNASSLLDDSPVSIPTERGLYLPKNYNESYKGLVTLRTSLASSLNTPAVKTLTLVGIEDFYALLIKLGFNITEKADFYGHALALGGVDVSLLELTNAYRVLANLGVSSPLRFNHSHHEMKVKRVLNQDVSFIISDILSDRSARQTTFGLENPLSTKSWSAVKTGTSKDMRDNWCIGYSDTYTVGVWVGNFSGEPMWNVSGVSGSAQIWQEIMDFLHRHRTSKPPKPPKNVVKKDVYIETADVSISDWFIDDGKYNLTDNKLIRVIRQQQIAKITYPPDLTVIVIDPDIPNTQQAVFFEVSGDSRGLRIFVEDEEITLNHNIAMWQPRVGRYKVKLQDINGLNVDEIEIVVR